MIEMSAQEIRNEIIQENLLSLIKQLTGFEDDESLRYCEHFAWTIIRNHRTVSTNSHEVKRKIECIQEKFVVDNCQEYADHLGLLCDEIIKHPLCLEHYEVDVHWSLLDFLLALTYNPTGALRRNKHKINLKSKLLSSETKEDETSLCKELLKEDFIPLTSYTSDAELSDWSDDSQLAGDSVSEPFGRNKNAARMMVTKLEGLQPPAKEKHYTLFNSKESQVHLLQHVQHTWWHTTKSFNAPVSSNRFEANFAVLYSKFLKKASNNLIRVDDPSTVPEICLMREVIWMFHSPQNCKFFQISYEGGVLVRPNVSTPSITVNVLSSFLEHEIIPYINMMSTLRTFLDSVYADLNVPKTLECYAANLRYLLEPIWQELLDYEARLIAQNDYDIITIIDMHSVLKKPLFLLETIHNIHSKAVLPLTQYPAHIVSSHLLASLMYTNETASDATEINLAFSLFLTTLKVFCITIDRWWVQGKLEDCQQEFLVECISEQTNVKIKVRDFSKNKEVSFFLPDVISKLITANSCFQLLLDHSLEAGFTLSLLYEIDKMSDLRNAYAAIEGNLYSLFLEDVMEQIKKLQFHIQDSAIIPADSRVDINDDAIESNPEDNSISLATTDEFLLKAFEYDNDETENDLFKETNNLTANDIWKELQKSKYVMLPLEELVFKSLKRILQSRIAFSDNFVMKLFRNEFHIFKHLKNIRKVLFLEDNDLMQQFYEKLFTNIESGEPWASACMLTMQLDAILCTTFPEMSLFVLDINSALRCKTNMVTEAVDEIIVTYNLTREISEVITENDIQEYNKVFRFLLKVKWGLTTLESLQFSRISKRRAPYAKYEMKDLLMRRLELLRFWMIYALQSIHSHLMTHVLHSMGEQLDEKIKDCRNLKEMIILHKSYISSICDQCFVTEYYAQIKTGIEQLLNLTYILRLEWNSCIKYIECNNPLAVDLSDGNMEDSDNDYLATSQIDGIEVTYIRCHQCLANWLNNEDNLNQKNFLSGLSSAFNTSLPC